MRSVIRYSLPTRTDLETDLLPNKDWAIRLPEQKPKPTGREVAKAAAFEAR